MERQKQNKMEQGLSDHHLYLYNNIVNDFGSLYLQLKFYKHYPHLLE